VYWWSESRASKKALGSCEMHAILSMNNTCNPMVTASMHPEVGICLARNEIHCTKGIGKTFMQLLGLWFSLCCFGKVQQNFSLILFQVPHSGECELEWQFWVPVCAMARTTWVVTPKASLSKLILCVCPQIPTLMVWTGVIPVEYSKTWYNCFGTWPLSC
jgi:hypothetical protein